MLEAGPWRSPPLLVARTFADRWRGMRRVGAGGLLLWSRSVHGFGIGRPLTLLRLDPGGRVVDVRGLSPRRVAAYRSGGWIVELPEGAAVPGVGEVLAVLSILRSCPAG